MESLSALRERRAYECRLAPARALGSLDEAEGFLCDRGMLTRTTDSFATWPATKWPRSGALTERGYLCVAVHRGKNLLVNREIAGLLDGICRAETERMRTEDTGWRRLFDHLAQAGPSSPEDLRLELGLKRQEPSSPT